jgi:hypothetical protein
VKKWLMVAATLLLFFGLVMADDLDKRLDATKHTFLPACYNELSCKGPDYYYKGGILTPLPYSVHCLGPCEH